MATEAKQQTSAVVRDVQNFIAGSWRSVASPTEPVYNPATGAEIASTPLSTAEEVEEAVVAAAQAFPNWSATAVGFRTDILFRFRALLTEHFEELASLVTLENGKDLKDARGEVRRGIEVGDFACGMPTLLMGESFFLGPTLLDHVTPDMTVAREEIFGPVLCVVRVENLDEAIAFVNGSRFGNACSLFTRSGSAARTLRERVGAGMLGINVGVAAPMAYFPFNGIKDSFYGDLHATGKDGVRFFTESRVEITRWFS